MPASTKEAAAAEHDWLISRRPTAEMLPPLGGSARRWRALAPPREDFWPRLGYSFALAGTLFSALVAVTWVFAITCGNLAGGLSLASLSAASTVSATVGLLIAAVASVGAGFSYAGLLALLTLPGIANLLRLAGIDQQQMVRSAPLIGSLLAAVAMVPFGVLALHNTDSQGVLAVGVWLLHLASAICLGQLSGLFASIRDIRRRSRQPRKRTRWGLYQMLSAVAVTSLVMAGLDSMGVLNSAVLLSLATAVAAHFAVRRPLDWLVNRWADQRLRQRRGRRLDERST